MTTGASSVVLPIHARRLLGSTTLSHDEEGQAAGVGDVRLMNQKFSQRPQWFGVVSNCWADY